MTGSLETYEVDPDRLASGRWSQEFNATVGEGDISASYSGDSIGLQGKARKPFVYNGDLWVSVGQCEGTVKAYRLVPIAFFTEGATDYVSKTSDCKAARADPNGFYHGIAVTHRKDRFVLCGPPAVFVPGALEQPGLFRD